MLQYGTRIRSSTKVTDWLVTYPSIPKSLEPHLWLDAADTASITSSSTYVSSWADKSGNGHHVSQDTGANQPVTGTQTVNGRNVLVFSGSQSLKSTGSTNLNVGVFTLFAVFDETTAVNFAGVLAAASTSGADWTQSNSFTANTSSSFSNRSFWIERNNGVAGRVLGSKPSAFGIYSVQSFSDGSIQSWYNGNTAVSETSTGSFGIANAGFVAGARWNGTGVDGGLIGRIAELIVFSRSLTTAEMGSVHAYLKSKWGIA